MRIIAGIHKGRSILSIDSKEVRPTTSRTREALFSILTSGQFLEDGVSILQDAVVADICCGTGALGLEALSRGAKQVVFVDSAQEMLEVVKKNLAKFGEGARGSVFRADASALPPAKVKCKVVLIDPPYRSGLPDSILDTLGNKGWLEQGGIVVVEVDKKETLDLPEGFTLMDDRNYGKTRMIIARWGGKG